MKKVFGVLIIVILFLVLYIALDKGKGLNMQQIETIKGKIAKLDIEIHSDEVTKAQTYLSDLIKIKSVRNQELGAAEYLKKILNDHNINSQIFSHPEYPQKANLVAEIPGSNPNLPGLILLSHLDVVEAAASTWDFDPFAGEIRDGYVHGRGAIDMKGMTVIELMTFLSLNQQTNPPERKVMLLAVADEENGGDLGIQYLLKNHPDLFKGYRYAINEGGIGIEDFPVKGAKVFNIQFAEKGILQFKATVKDKAAHGSSPPNNYSILKLSSFMSELKVFFSPRVISKPIETFFYQMGEALPFPKSFFLRRVGNPIVQKLVGGVFKSNRHLSSMTSNSVAFTGLSSNEGSGYNSIPSHASVKIDIRTLPETVHESLIQEIEKIAKNYNVELELYSSVEGNHTDFNNDLYSYLAASTLLNVDGATVTTFMSAGGTDSRFLRNDLKIEAFGLIPGLFSLEEIDGIHGPNERMSIESLQIGIKILRQAVFGFVTSS